MVSEEFIAKTMARLAALGGICQLHCENGDVLAYREDKGIAEGRTAPTDFPPTCPDWTEEEAINRAVLIARLTGCPAYVVHLSTKVRSEEHTSELQSRLHLVCRLLLEKKKKQHNTTAQN